MEGLKQYIKETLERNEPCPFRLRYIGDSYCFLSIPACDLQGHDEFVAGLVTGRTRFKVCSRYGEWKGV